MSKVLGALEEEAKDEGRVEGRVEGKKGRSFYPSLHCLNYFSSLNNCIHLPIKGCTWHRVVSLRFTSLTIEFFLL